MQTDFGVNHPLAVKLWSRALIHEAIGDTWFGKFMGTGANSIVQIKTETQKDAGDKVTFGLRMRLENAGTGGDDTLEGNEEALVTHSDALYVDQLRHAVISRGKMSEQRVPFSVREEARLALTDWFSERFDGALFKQLCGYSAETDTKQTGSNAALAPTASRIIACGTDGNTEGSLSAGTTHVLTLADIDKAVARAKTGIAGTTTGLPRMRPLKIGGQDHFIMVIHPFQTYRLRQQTSTGQWADIQKAAMMGGKYADNPLVTGALGIYNNVILHEDERITATSASDTNYRRAVFLGAQAAALAFGQGGSPNKMTWVEELFDYGNKLGVAAGAIWGCKKTVFNSVDYSTIVMTSYAPGV